MPPSAEPSPVTDADDASPRVAQRDQDGQPWAVASGRWTAMGMSDKPAWEALGASLGALPGDRVAWDLRPVEQLDHIGAQLLWNHWGQAWPGRLEMDSQHKAVLDQVAQYTCSPPEEPPVTLADRFKAFAHTGPRIMF